MKGGNKKMRKNFFKKLVTAVVTTAMTVSAIVAMPTEAKADTTKDVYLVAEDASYTLGIWNKYGFASTATSADEWNFAWNMTKVEDGLYKIDLTATDDCWTDGIEISDGSNTYKVYTSTESWAVAEQMGNWTAVEAALKGAEDVYLALDATNTTIALTTAPATDDTTSDDTTADNTTTDDTATNNTTTDNNTTVDNNTTTDTNVNAATTPDTGDSTMVALYMVVAALAAVVVLKKKTANN